MTELTRRESTLVALGAAIASNCVPCVEHLIPQARDAGLRDDEIDAALRRADTVRRVPARTVLDAALKLLSVHSEPERASADSERTTHGMAPMMDMMRSCRAAASSAAAHPGAAGAAQAGSAQAPARACGC